MKAQPTKLIYGEGYKDCSIEEATHVKINIPGPTGILYLPVILKGSRKDTHCWSWNGDTEKPTLKPSVLNEGTEFIGGDPLDKNNWVPFRCHTWINNGQAIFLDDTDHQYKGQTLDLIDL